MSGKLQQVHLRVNDAATGKPTPVRLRVTDAEGNYYAPFGRLTRFATEPGVDVGHNVLHDGEAWAIIDGACEIAVPPGLLRIQATKGPEYRPLDTEVHLHPGKMALRLMIERWSDPRAEGWHTGDTCAYFLAPHAALLEAAAEDLAVVDLLIREGSNGQTPTLANISAFSGQSPALARDGHHVVVNSRNDGPGGRLLLLNCHRVVYPLSFGEGERWTLLDWCDQCHRKGGLVVADDWLDRANPELLTDDFLRHIDAIRYLPGHPLEPWFDVLNRGFRLPLVAGSGKQSNREVLGAWRTYAQLPPDQPFDYRAWIDAVRAGRSFVTRGPLLRFALERNELQAEAMALLALERLEIVHNGAVVATESRPATTLRTRVSVPASGWAIARCVDHRGVAALTAPAYLP